MKYHQTILLSLLVASLALVGCTTRQQAETSEHPEGAKQQQATSKQTVQLPPQKLLQFIATALEERDLQQAQNFLTKAEGSMQEFSKTEQKQFAELARQLELLRDGQQTPVAQLRDAEDFLQRNQLAEAQLALETLPDVTSLPASQAEQAADLTQKLEQRLALVQELKQAALESASHASDQLWSEPALGIQALAAAWQESPAQRPQFLAEAIQLAQTPANQRILAQQIQRTQPLPNDHLAPIALGPVSGNFLEVALNSADDDERRTALRWLAVVQDPPPETFFTLLPLCQQESAFLKEACLAVNHAAWVHHQREVLAIRNPHLSDEQRATLKNFRQQLLQLATSEELAAENSEAWLATQSLAVTLGVLSSQPIEKLSVFAASGAEADHPAEAVIDGKWPEKDAPGTQWYNPVDRPTWIVLDLGEPKPVCGVRIWNYSYHHDWGRGYRDVYLTVSNNPSDLQKHGYGFVPKGSYENTRQDFSTRIDLPLRTGRFVILRCGKSWHNAHRAGLAEVQILTLPGVAPSDG